MCLRLCRDCVRYGLDLFAWTKGCVSELEEWLYSSVCRNGPAGFCWWSPLHFKTEAVRINFISPPRKGKRKEAAPPVERLAHGPFDLAKQGNPETKAISNNQHYYDLIFATFFLSNANRRGGFLRVSI